MHLNFELISGFFCSLFHSFHFILMFIVIVAATSFKRGKEKKNYMKGYSISLNMRTQVDKTNILPYFLLTSFFNFLHIGCVILRLWIFLSFLHSFLPFFFACIILQFVISFLCKPYNDLPKMGMQKFQFFPCLFCPYAFLRINCICLFIRWLRILTKERKEGDEEKHLLFWRNKDQLCFDKIGFYSFTHMVALRIRNDNKEMHPFEFSAIFVYL